MNKWCISYPSYKQGSMNKSINQDIEYKHLFCKNLTENA